MIKNKKYLPLYYFIVLILFPIIFGYALEYFFHLGSIEKTMNFKNLFLVTSPIFKALN